MKRIKEKKERSLGVKLFLKADRCNSPKCVTVRRPNRPGQHGTRRSNKTEYGTQLQEKQKIQIYFGLNNRQMQQLFKLSPEVIKARLMERLDQVVFLIGLARSPRIARQLIGHGHIMVNGRKVTISSFNVTIGDTISIRPESKPKKVFEDIKDRLAKYEPPLWLTLNKESLEGKCVASVLSTDAQFPFDVSVAGQFYAR